MNPERWKTIERIFHEALALPASERDNFLTEACEQDASLRQAVESLLQHNEQAESFIAAPAFTEFGGLIEERESLTGQSIGHYQIIKLLGEGGMGEVYLAQDEKLGRKVALKFLPSVFTKDKQRLQRFEQEARATSALNHPNIVTIYEFGEIDGSHFIASELIEGQTLRERLTAAPMKPGETLDIAVQVAGALAAAHDARIIHRDIKTDNIMLRRDGIVKVLDFGLAKLTTAQTLSGSKEQAGSPLRTTPGMVLGTASYMSPEQARGTELDARTDIFSLGVVLYEMVAGCLPFVGATNSEVMAEILADNEAPPLSRFSREAPRELEHIVGKVLRKDRDQRYQTVKDLLIDLKDLRRDLEVQAQIERTSAPERISSSSEQASDATRSRLETGIPTAPATSSAEYIVNQAKLHKRGAVIALGVLALAVGFIAFWYFNRTRAAPLTDKDTILLADFVNTTGDAAFDGTLKQALAIQLEQSPFLNIFSEDRVRETLRLMARSPDERVTKDVAREICQRQSLKAYLAGSISNLGSHLVMTLEAVNAQTGETLARQQIEAANKEQVLSALGQAATKLREKLGESLASIQKYEAPIEQATTSSLEALKAYSLAREQIYEGKSLEAIPFYKRAIELDPNFARAYAALGVAYSNSGQLQLAREAAQKAFELRERVSEHEKLRIAENYYRLVTGEVEKAIEALELVTRTYPRDDTAYLNLANGFNAIGRYEQGIEAAREAIRLNPNSAFPYDNLAFAFRRLNRFDEAKEVSEQALERKLDTTRYHADLYEIAFVRGDTAAMQQQLDWARGKPNEYVALFWQADTAEFLGQWRRARELNQRGADEQLIRNLKESAAGTMSANALTAAVTGNCQQAREDIARASALPRTSSSFSRMGMALALCGELGPAQSLADEYAKQYPKSTLANAVWQPAIRAAVEIRRNNPAQAVQFLQSANRYDRTGDYWPEYLRGEAYLAQHSGTEAAAEFQKILDHRGLSPTSVLYPLAHLGVARASVLQGDTVKARQAYEDFFTIWKDADPDIPILIEAKKEYAKLK